MPRTVIEPKLMRSESAAGHLDAGVAATIGHCRYQNTDAGQRNADSG